MPSNLQENTGLRLISEPNPNPNSYNASSWVVFPFQEAQPNTEMKTLYIYISHTKNQDELFKLQIPNLYIILNKYLTCI
jgi:hypothetical protein